MRVFSLYVLKCLQTFNLPQNSVYGKCNMQSFRVHMGFELTDLFKEAQRIWRLFRLFALLLCATFLRLVPPPCLYVPICPFTYTLHQKQVI